MIYIRIVLGCWFGMLNRVVVTQTNDLYSYCSGMLIWMLNRIVVTQTNDLYSHCSGMLFWDVKCYCSYINNWSIFAMLQFSFTKWRVYYLWGCKRPCLLYQTDSGMWLFICAVFLSINRRLLSTILSNSSRRFWK